MLRRLARRHRAPPGPAQRDRPEQHRAQHAGSGGDGELRRGLVPGMLRRGGGGLGRGCLRRRVRLRGLGGRAAAVAVGEPAAARGRCDARVGGRASARTGTRTRAVPVRRRSGGWRLGRRLRPLTPAAGAVRARDGQPHAGLDHVRIGEAHAVRCDDAAVGVEQLRPVLGAAELPLGDPGQRVARTDRHLGVVVRGPARPGRGHRRGLVYGRGVVCRRGVVCGCGRGRRGGDVRVARQQQLPAGLEGSLGVEDAVLGVHHPALVEGGDLPPALAGAEGPFGDAPQRVGGTGGPDDVVRVLRPPRGGGTGRGGGGGSTRRRGHARRPGDGVVGGARRAGGQLGRGRAGRGEGAARHRQDREDRADEAAGQPLAPAERGQPPGHAAAQLGGDLDDHREGEGEPRCPADDDERPQEEVAVVRGGQQLRQRRLARLGLERDGPGAVAERGGQADEQGEQCDQRAERAEERAHHVTHPSMPVTP